MNAEQEPGIVLLDKRIETTELDRLTRRFFRDMVKFVVDLEIGTAAVGGELHADAEALLLERGSRQESLWGGNYYPGRGREDCIEYTSLINIRPAQENRGMMVEDEVLRSGMRRIVFALIGEGEPLS